MKTIFGKEEIEMYSQKVSKYCGKTVFNMGGDIDENDRNELNLDFEENAIYCDNCFDGLFEQINICRFGDRLFIEVQKLGDYDGHFGDWSTGKYMQTLYEICENVDEVWVSNYEYSEDDPAGRAFFIAFLFDINEFQYYEEVYKYCHDFCKQLDTLVERKLKGCYWDKKFEEDEMEFCRLYLTPFLRKLDLNRSYLIMAIRSLEKIIF